MDVLTADEIAKLNAACPALRQTVLGTILYNLSAGLPPAVPLSVTGLEDSAVTPVKMDATALYRERAGDRTTADLTASLTAAAIAVAHTAGTIPRAGFRLANTGTDASNPLSAELDVLINGVSIFTTKPVIAKAAADGAHSFTAGTGVTVGVVNAAANIIAAGDVITYTLTMTRTATPGDEMDGLLVDVELAYKVGA